jgi:diguanylate cyclase (GGDEF)-like protein/PAS domain S-box-containing protein
MRVSSFVQKTQYASGIHLWRRVVLPFGDVSRGSYIVSLTKPAVMRHEVFGTMARVGTFGTLTLEPMHGPDGSIADYALLAATDVDVLTDNSLPPLLSQLTANDPGLVGRLGELAEGELAAELTLHRLIKGKNRVWRARIWATAPRPLLLLKDVTDEVEAREALENSRKALTQSEARFGDFARSSSDWFWETDAEHRFTVLDSRTVVIAGLGAPNLGKRRIDLPILDAYREAVEQNHRDMCEGKEFRNLIYRIRTTSGEVRGMRVSGLPVFDANKNFIGYRGTTVDITAELAAQADLAENQAALERSQRAARLGHWRWIAATNETFASSELMCIARLPAGSAVPANQVIIDLIHPEDRKGMARALNAALTSTESVSYRCRIVRETGDVSYLRFQMEPERNDAGVLIGLFGICQDETELRQAELLLEAQTRILSAAQKIGRVGNWDWKFGDEGPNWSEQMFEILRYDPTSFQPNAEAMVDRCTPADRLKLLAAMSDISQSGGITNLDLEILRGDDTYGSFALCTKVMLDHNNTIIGYVGTLQDISERKDAERRLQAMAYTDPLTGLANRVSLHHELDNRLAEAAEAGGSSLLMLLDLDRFKEVNDSLGHAAGDALLVAVAARLKEVLGEQSFIARLGGDEFAVVDPRSTSECEALSHRLIAALTAPFTIEETEVNVGVSIGVALLPRDGSTAAQLLGHADLALYQAKDEGRGRMARFRAELTARAVTRATLSSDLRHAIENGELEAFGQAQLSLGTGKVIGIEALLRWNHPERGNISPVEFIPIAETTGRISALGDWVLNAACAGLRDWIRQGANRRLSVNVSAAELRDPGYVRRFAETINRHGLTPSNIKLEVTESIFVSPDFTRASRFLHELREMGVHLALDDFGTGYSSLGYLARLPVVELKIGRIFVSGIDQDAEKLKLLEGVVGLGRGLGMSLVAEGAETAAEVDVLRRLKLDVVQGYFFSRPVPIQTAPFEAARVEMAAMGARLANASGQRPIRFAARNG